jgi:vacuolar-type H+-ATPase subunit C/Vma6
MYRDLVTSPGIDQMLASLADTAYREDVEAAMTRGRGLGRLDETVRRHLARTMRHMRSFYEGRPGVLVGLVTDRWDRNNLRVLLRLPEGPGRAELVDPLLIPAGRLDEAALRELAALPDAASRLDLLVSWELPSAEAAHALLRASREPSPRSLEVALDQVYASHVDETLGHDRTGAAAVLRAEADTTNLLTSLRIREAAAAGEPFPEPDQVGYLPGGLVDPSRWPEIATLLDPEEVITEIGRQPTLPGWDIVVADWGEHQDLTLLADRLRRATTRTAVSLLTRGDPLGLDVPVGYAHAKEAEVRNLRLIGRGIVHQLPAGEVAAMLEEAA